MPFVQGQLRRESISVTIDSQCAHCSRPMRLHVDGDLNYRSEDATDPMIYLPIVDFAKLKEPSIIDSF